MPVGVGEIVEGTVTGITNFGAFVQLPGGETGLVHISEVADTYVKDIRNYLSHNEKIQVKVIGIEKGKISLSIRQIKHKKNSQPPQYSQNTNRREFEMSFEDKLAQFLKDSEERQQALKKNQESKRGFGGSRRRESIK
ncbi:MAG TPA: S1 RNA-binding domain-containing protein [Thermoanaerobacterales bacterium]|nr:S1 RNA-binding domain-containing protein [Thermoanaerobacterales bacterium]